MSSETVLDWFLGQPKGCMKYTTGSVPMRIEGDNQPIVRYNKHFQNSNKIALIDDLGKNK